MTEAEREARAGTASGAGEIKTAPVSQKEEMQEAHASS